MTGSRFLALSHRFPGARVEENETVTVNFTAYVVKNAMAKSGLVVVACVLNRGTLHYHDDRGKALLPSVEGKTLTPGDNIGQTHPGAGYRG